MSFKDRKIVKMDLIEEAYQEKLDNAWNGIKDFAKNNPGMATVGGGAALGALTNYLNDGGDSLETSRQADLEAIPAEVKSDVASDIGMSKNSFSDFAKNYENAYDKEDGALGNSLDYIRGIVPGMSTDAEAQEVVDSALARSKFDNSTTELSADAGGVTMDGYNYNPKIDMDTNYAAYQNHIASNPTDTNASMVNSKINAAEAAQVKNIANSDRDSYLRSIGAGAALGGAGLFAKRKIDASRN